MRMQAEQGPDNSPLSFQNASVSHGSVKARKVSFLQPNDVPDSVSPSFVVCSSRLFAQYASHSQNLPQLCGQSDCHIPYLNTGAADSMPHFWSLYDSVFDCFAQELLVIGIGACYHYR
jgi:hypothetical protein